MAAQTNGSKNQEVASTETRNCPNSNTRQKPLRLSTLSLQERSAAGEAVLDEVSKAVAGKHNALLNHDQVSVDVLLGKGNILFNTVVQSNANVVGLVHPVLPLEILVDTLICNDILIASHKVGDGHFKGSPIIIRDGPRDRVVLGVHQGVVDGVELISAVMVGQIERVTTIVTLDIFIVEKVHIVEGLMKVTQEVDEEAERVRQGNILIFIRVQPVANVIINVRVEVVVTIVSL